MREFPEFILASRSPRRAELLREAGYRFAVVVPPVTEPETLSPESTPKQLAEALAYYKARSVQKDHPERIVLGADTLVVRGRRILGKARDGDGARRMLAALSGSRHSVITALALLLPPGGRDDPAGASRRLLAAESTGILMRRLTDGELEGYVASGEWRDKAGAYAVQETADAFIERIDGSYTNVVGLPMELLERLCRRALRLLAPPEEEAPCEPGPP